MTTQRDMLVETYTKLGIPFKEETWRDVVYVKLSADDGLPMGGYSGFACEFMFDTSGVLKKVLIIE